MARIRSGLPFVLVVLTILISYSITDDLTDENFVILTVFSIITLCLHTPYFWFRRKSSKHGKLHFTLTLLALFCTLTLAFMVDGGGEDVTWFLRSWLFLSTLALISNFIAVPLYILPALSARDETPASSDETVAIIDLESMIKEIRTKFDTFHQAISQEHAGLQKMFSRIQEEFQSQTDTIAQVRGR